MVRYIMMNQLILNKSAADVMSVYSGVAGACCCGCKGKHSYSSQLKAEAGEARGYVVTNDEVNDRQVTRVLNIIKKNAENVDWVTDNIASVEVGNRLYFVTFAPDSLV